ncbi:WD40 repeat-like protein [Backusella circina FSU 941]|nr:WD40 repeat-like protein [Backusella circina FSU 941]
MYDLIAYAAGAVVVLYNHKRNKQVAFLYPPSPIQTPQNSQPSQIPNVTALGSNELLPSSVPVNQDDDKKGTAASTRAKTISCLAFSPDGNYLAVGEMGHQPRIFIWDVKARKLVKEFRSHKFGVLALSFSPNMRYLVSVGFQHDGYLYVWDWKKGTRLAGNKVTSRVNAVSFSKDGSYFVTAGLRHVKFWYLNARGRMPKRGNLSSETQVLDGRSGILGVLRDANFVNVACDPNNTGHTYFITDTGILCTFKEGRVIDKWVNLQVKNTFSITVSPNYVICACSEGLIRLFEPVTLKYVCVLPKPHSLGTDVSLVTSPDMVRPADANTFYPDAVAMEYDEQMQRVTVIYSDRSLYIWDIRDLKKVGKYRSFLFHSDCVWGVELCPTIKADDDLPPSIPVNSFATFSADGTVRIWNLDNPHLVSSTSTSPQSPTSNNMMSPSSSTTATLHRRNIYSRDLVKMLYVDPDAAEFSKLRRDMDITEDEYPDFGIRALKMSSDGKMMATGDRSGNLRVHDMHNWNQLTYQEAHDSEILAIDLTSSKDGPCLVATASRDRLLHIFDIRSGFQLVQSLDDHSSSITAVKFSDNATKLISCGADKGIIFRHRVHPVTQFSPLIPRPYSTYHNYSGRSTVFDMALDINGRYIATVTGERRLYVLSVESGKPFRVCKPETTDEIGKSSENSGGSLINIDLDPFSGTYAVTSGSDRSIRIFDLTNSTCIEKVCAHAELITSVKFLRTNTEDGLRVISTCSDGTVFVWKVSNEIIAKMYARASDHTKLKQIDVEEESAITTSQQRFLAQQQRLRRVSTASAIKPTASISQMIRQGERRTFSTMSPAEQKYDDMYKRIAAGRKNRIDTGSAKNQEIQQHENQSPAIFKPSDIKPLPNRPGLVKRESRGNLQQHNEPTSTGRKTPEKYTGKLERLYNGLPTRSKPPTIPSVPPPSYNGHRPPVSPPHSSLGGNRVNTVLRRAISRDSLVKNEKHRKSPTGISATAQKQRDHVITRRSSQPLYVRKESDSVNDNEPKPIDTKLKDAIDDADDECSKEGGEADDEKEREDGDEEEDEDDDDDGEVEEEEEIIFTPEQEKVNQPFEVSTHHSQDGIEVEDGRTTPISDGEGAEQITQIDEDEGSSEDNVDDAIIRAINSRKPQRISTSLSRTTSSVRRHSLHMDQFTDMKETNITPCSPPEEDNDEILKTKSNIAFLEIQRKLEKANKRQSLTARFLSSQNATDTETTRPTLDNIMTTFQQMATTQPNTPSPVIANPIVNKEKQEHVKIESSINNDDDRKSSIQINEESTKQQQENGHEIIMKDTNQGFIGKETNQGATRLDDNSELVKEIDHSENVEDPTALNQTIENTMGDLDGAIILLESVLESYASIVNVSKESSTAIENKLDMLVEKIIERTGKQKQESQETKLLERYSTLLLNMVQEKINK